MAGDTTKHSERLEGDNWIHTEEPPIDGEGYASYAVIFHGSSHYYFGGYYQGYLDSILRLQSGSWTWTNVGQMNSARSSHAVTLVNEMFMVVGGYGNVNNEACVLNNGQFNCTELSSSLNNYVVYPLLFSVADNYGSC